MLNRLTSVRHSLSANAFLVSTPTNIHYLTDFSPLASPHREALLLITPQKAILFHSPLAKPTLAPPIITTPFTLPFAPKLKRILHNDKCNTLSFEPQNLTVAEYVSLKKTIKLIPQTPAVATLRQEKDDQEIALITQACRLATKTVTFLRQSIQPGQTEKEVAWLAEKYLMENGADSLAFPIIVASGPHSAIPHHTSSTRKFKKNDTILIDLGCKVNGYCSDITRTFFIGKSSLQQNKVEAIVKKAHSAAISILAARRLPRNLSLQGYRLAANQVDAAARAVITRAKHGKHFIHGTGHSLGLDIHEPPHISPHSKDILKPNMVITIEPGVYLPSNFGYRHEDTILITKSAYQNLTSTSYKL